MAYIFPIDAGKTAWDSTKTQSWAVTEQETASGKRRAICNQLYPRYTFSIRFPVLRDDELDTLMGFYGLRKGSLIPFFYKDCIDYHMEKQTLQPNADGKYQCVINTGGFLEPCYYVENLHVFVNDVEVTNFTQSGGLITLTASGTVTASYDYYWRVRFESSISSVKVFKNVNEVSLKLTTVR